ncbi:N-formylglutamate amidohydrolase [Litorimonas haliclonae]
MRQVGGMTEPFKLIPEKGNHDIFVFGDHASNQIPSELNNLGLSGEDLTRHIAWDIGTETVIRQLCEHFGCVGQLAGFSRLVIDPNRGTDAIDLVPEISDGTKIPGNSNLSAKDVQQRIERYYQPYHNQVNATLKALGNPFVIYIHSFTPHPHTGEKRSMDFGLLVKHDPSSAEVLRQNLVELPQNFTVEVNEPYSAEYYNHTMDTHVTSPALRHLAIEIRQDHIDTEEKARQIAALLADCIEPIINGTVSPLST